MTFKQFLKKCQLLDDWALVEWQGRRIIRRRGDFYGCPLAEVFGQDFSTKADAAGLFTSAIVAAADGLDNSYRKALLTLVPA